MNQKIIITIVAILVIIGGWYFISNGLSGTSDVTQDVIPDYKRYINISSDYSENPSVGDIINFPITIEVKQNDYIGDAGYLNFYLAEGVSVDDSKINFVLEEAPINLTVPVTIERGDDRAFIYMRGNVIHKEIEIPFGASFMIEPAEYNRRDTDDGRAIEGSSN